MKRRRHQEIIKVGAQSNKIEKEYNQLMKHGAGPLSLLLDKIDKPLLKEGISKFMKSKLKTGTK